MRKLSLCFVLVLQGCYVAPPPSPVYYPGYGYAEPAPVESAGSVIAGAVVGTIAGLLLFGGYGGSNCCYGGHGWHGGWSHSGSRYGGGHH